MIEVFVRERKGKDSKKEYYPMVRVTKKILFFKHSIVRRIGVHANDTFGLYTGYANPKEDMQKAVDICEQYLKSLKAKKESIREKDHIIGSI